LAEQLWKIARAKERRLLFFFGDLDGLKQINDRYGHREGDRALLRVAASFRKTFRGSAVAARIGGDEFIALLIEGPRRNVDSIRRRLQSNLARRVADNARYAVTLSIGASLLDPQSACNLDELIVRADRALYAQKQLRFTGVAANSVATVTEHLARPICESAANSSPYEKGPAASSWSGDSRQSGDRLCGEARR
jgi:diguanylate cyclase (GGDEF)-like protein